MRIRTLFITTMVAFGLVLAGVAVSMGTTSMTIAQLDGQEAKAVAIGRGIEELGLLAGEYLLYGDAHKRERWQSKRIQVATELRGMALLDDEGRDIAARMTRNLERLAVVFAEVSAKGGLAERSAEATGPDVALQVSWSRLAVQNQAIAVDASRLEQSLREDKTQVQGRNAGQIAALLGVLGAYFLATYAIVIRRTLGSVARLREGTRLVGMGDLGHRVEVGPNDEIGELSRAFNRMTSELDKVTTTKARLESEIAERLAAEEKVRASEARLRRIIDEVPIGVTLLDPAGAVLEVNDANRIIWGYTLPKAEDVSQYVLYEAYRHGTDQPMKPEDWPVVRTIATGAPAEDIVDIARADDTRLAVRVRTVPVKDEAGEIQRIIGITEDVNEALERERLSDALNKVANAMSGSLELEEILHSLVSAGMESLGAESAWIRMRQGDGWVVEDVRGISGGPDDTGAEEHLATTRLALGAAGPIAVDDVESDPRVEAEPYRCAGVRSFIAFPILAQGNALGVVAFQMRSRPASFSPVQVDFASGLMTSASFALESALLYERERRIADALQEALITPPEDIPGIRTAYVYRPASQAANVGGDFYDVFAIDEDRAGVLIGDVSGKGLEAAQLTSLARNGVRSYGYECDDPAVVLEKVNRLLHRSTRTDAFATIFFGVLQPSTGLLRYCSAGHPAAIVARADGSTALLATTSPIVGAFAEVRFVQQTTSLREGDVLILYTDGITEGRRDGEFYGEARVVDSARELAGTPLEALPQALLEKAETFASRGLSDDTVVLCLALESSTPAADPAAGDEEA